MSFQGGGCRPFFVLPLSFLIDKRNNLNSSFLFSIMTQQKQILPKDESHAQHALHKCLWIGIVASAVGVGVVFITSDVHLQQIIFLFLTGLWIAMLGYLLKVQRKYQCDLNHQFKRVSHQKKRLRLLARSILNRESDNAKQLEHYQKLEETVRLYSTAIRQAPASIVVTNRLGDICFVNKRFEEITGYTLQEVLGKNPRVLQSGTHSVQYYKNLWETILDGRIWRGQFCNYTRSGEIYWESATISPIKNEIGQITHFIAVKEDITQRKKLEQRLREGEEKFKLVFENCTQPVFIVSQEDNMIEDANYAASQMLNVSTEEMVSTSVFNWLDPVDKKDWQGAGNLKVHQGTSRKVMISAVRFYLSGSEKFLLVLNPV